MTGGGEKERHSSMSKTRSEKFEARARSPRASAELYSQSGSLLMCSLMEVMGLDVGEFAHAGIIKKAM